MIVVTYHGIIYSKYLFNSVSATFILYDEVMFQPLISSSALAELQESGTQSALQSAAVRVCSFEEGMTCTVYMYKHTCLYTYEMDVYTNAHIACLKFSFL